MNPRLPALDAVRGVAIRRQRYRESPALQMVALLARLGAQVSYAGPCTSQPALGGFKLSAVEPSAKALAAADCVLILTSHSSFDYAEIAGRAPLVVDTRNAMKHFRGARASIVSL